MKDPMLLPVVRVELTLADGTLLTREWLMNEAGSIREALRSPPAWLEEPRRRWDHPHDPITFSGRVREGHEADARALVNPGPATGEGAG